MLEMLVYMNLRKALSLYYICLSVSHLTSICLGRSVSTLKSADYLTYIKISRGRFTVKGISENLCQHG
jgi:hypothetical protein